MFLNFNPMNVESFRRLVELALGATLFLFCAKTLTDIKINEDSKKMYTGELFIMQMFWLLLNFYQKDGFQIGER